MVTGKSRATWLKLRRLKLLSLILLTALIVSTAISEDLIVTASILNGRERPGTNAAIEAFWDRGDLVEPTGEWSTDHQWVEIFGGETGTVWCSIKYLTERSEPFKVTNENRSSIKIRKRPVNGTVIGYLKPGKTITITQVVLGWGKCKSGWVDLGYLVEIEE